MTEEHDAAALDVSLSSIVDEMTEFVLARRNGLSDDAVLAVQKVGAALLGFAREIQSTANLTQTLQRLEALRDATNEPRHSGVHDAHEDLAKMVRGHQERMLQVLEALCAMGMNRGDAAKVVARVMGPMYTKVIGPFSGSCSSGAR